eukprot:5211671-Pyramimonas_sp.AAC.1
MCSEIWGVSRFAVSRAFLLLGCASAKGLASKGISKIHDSVFFGDGSDWCLSLFAGAYLGYTARLEPEAMERLCSRERVEFRRVARAMLGKGELAKI